MKKKFLLFVFLFILLIVPFGNKANAEDDVPESVIAYCEAIAQEQTKDLSSTEKDIKFGLSYLNCVGTVQTSCEGKNLEDCIPEEYKTAKDENKITPVDDGDDDKKTQEPKEEDKNNYKDVHELCVGIDAIVYYAIYAIKIIRIIVPILLIIWASIDLVKSIMSKDEKKIQEVRKPVIQRIISALIVFLLPWLVSLAVSSVSESGNNDWKACWKKAWNHGKQDDNMFNIKNW